MTELVERLREVATCGYTPHGKPDAASIMFEAATALASLADELRLARVLTRQWEVKALSAEQAINKAQERVAELEKALKESAGMLQASLPYWQTDERGNGPDCTPLLQAILNAKAALKEPR